MALVAFPTTRHAVWLVAALWGMIASPALAQTAPIEIDATVDRTTLTIDQRLRLTVTVRTSADAMVHFPEPGEKLGPFAVVSETTAEPEASGPDRVWRHEYQIEPEQVGPIVIPALAVSVEFEGDDAATVMTEPIEVTVEAVTPEDVDLTKPKDIAPPVALQPRGLPIAVWLLGTAALGLVVVAFVWWRRPRPRAPEPPQLMPAHRVALAELERLRVADGSDPAAVDAFHVRLAEILRRYLLWRYGWRAPTRTTEELLEIAARSESGALVADGSIADLLMQCDLVKFARHQPTVEDMGAVVTRLRQFIERTADDRVLVATCHMASAE